MNKKRVVILVSILLTFMCILLILVSLLRKSEDVDDYRLRSSDIAATNIARIDNFDYSKDSKELGFFTGSSSAVLNLANDKDFLNTKLLTDDFPLYNVDKVSGLDNKLLVRSYYYPPNSQLLNNYLSGSEPPRYNKQAWFLITSNSIKAAFPPKYNSVIDGILTKKGIVFLLSSGEKVDMLIKEDSGKYRSLVNDIAARKIIGSVGERIYLTDYAGAVYEHDGSSIKKIINSAIGVTLDKHTNKLIYSPINESISGDEGGVVEHNEEKGSNHDIKIRDLVTGEEKSYTPIEGYSDTYNGHIVTFNKISKPDKVEIYDLNNGEKQIVEIDHSGSKIIDPVSKIIVASKNPLILLSLTNNNRMVVYSDKDIINNVKSYNLPKVPVRHDQYTFDYSIMNSSVVMTADNNKTKNIVSKTVGILKDTCVCDVNQLNKTWVMIERQEGSL
ncbi:MAG TPA: hypothetical protein PKB09_00375 [Candidatus Saccharibacteria bacterium]|nr:hypothetical protein [Candidatus Saccharibacteria bacterium]